MLVSSSHRPINSEQFIQYAHGKNWMDDFSWYFGAFKLIVIAWEKYTRKFFKMYFLFHRRERFKHTYALFRIEPVTGMFVPHDYS